MSEYQRISFRAIDGPVSEENLDYMRRQSSRAEITAWSFDNEYHFGDFRGNAVEMLRRGYDLHLHFANYGIRNLLIRLPSGVPDFKAVKPYFGKDSLQFLQDKQGPGGILSIQPFHEPGDLEDLWEFDGLLDRLVPLRAEILDGDLRPFYLANLAINCDYNHDPHEAKEGPVPAGLEKLSDAQRTLAELYGLGDSLIAAAAEGSPRLGEQIDPRNQYAQWLRSVPQASKDGWLAQWMSDAHSSVRREMLAEFRKNCPTSGWPTMRRDRTIAELKAKAAAIQAEADRKATAKAASQKVKKLAAMAADPATTLRETEDLVSRRSTAAYRQIATLLVELREALADTKQSGLAEQQARKLKDANPKLNRLTAELRRQGFLPK